MLDIIRCLRNATLIGNTILLIKVVHKRIMGHVFTCPIGGNVSLAIWPLAHDSLSCGTDSGIYSHNVGNVSLGLII